MLLQGQDAKQQEAVLTGSQNIDSPTQCKRLWQTAVFQAVKQARPAFLKPKHIAKHVVHYIRME